ncbi:MAG: SRPBCC family protein [Thermodesulfobacteriota bacterium]
MAVTVSIDLSRTFSVTSSPDASFDLLSDVPRSVSHFPKVDKLVDLGDNAYRWEMQKIGIDKYSIQTIYACKYMSDKKAKRIWWTPVSGVGNGVVQGSWKISAAGGGSKIEFEAKGELTLPLPGLAKLVVTPVVRREFAGMVDRYIENLKKTLGT